MLFINMHAFLIRNSVTGPHTFSRIRLISDYIFRTCFSALNKLILCTHRVNTMYTPTLITVNKETRCMYFALVNIQLDVELC